MKSIRKRRTLRGRQYFPVDAAWKGAIRARLDELNMNQAELARLTGAAPSLIVLLFKPETIQSRIVPAVHRALGLDPPVATTTVVRASEAA